MSLNVVAISGNLTRDPELRATGSGMQILKLGVAVNERVKVNDEWTDKAHFIDCVMFGKRAESVSNYLSKGSKVAIKGRLSYSTWESKDGEKRSKLEVIVDDIEFLSRGQQSGSAPDVDEEIPF